MELYLQFGYGMMKLSQELITHWQGGSVILSPRDLNVGQILRLSSDLIKIGGNILVDPQFYLPRADHPRLTSYKYWPRNYETQNFSDTDRTIMLQELVNLNNRVRTNELIIPGERASEVNDYWLASQYGLLHTSREISNVPIIATVCLSAEVIRSSEQINMVIEQAESSTAEGYYLVLEHPRNEYLVSDPQWLANELDLIAALRRLGAKVIVGYSNQQQLIAACAGASAIASGTWMNVRSFLPEKFRVNYDDEIKRKAIWYYCPQALSEYKLNYLDIGVRLGLKEDLKPCPTTTYAESLFESPMPSASGWSFSLAFKHYLDALKNQVEFSSKNTFNETMIYHRSQLDIAEDSLNKFRQNGVLGQLREYNEALDANRSALVVLENTQGALLKRRWNNLL